MRHAGKWIALTATAMFNWLPIYADSSDPGPGPQTETTKMNGLNDPRLPAYLHGEAKYHVLPVPTPLDRAAAAAFVATQLPLARSSEDVSKLARLAMFYDLKETADAFLSVAKLAGREPADPVRASAAVSAVAWIGDPDQFAQAQTQFAELVRQSDFETHRLALLDVNYALGPRVGSEPLKQAHSAAVARLRSQLAGLRQKGQPAEVTLLENRVARLEEFAGLEIANLDKANKIRSAIEALPGEAARLPRLVELYLDDTPDSTPQLADWAGLKLLRLTEREIIGPEFLAQAGRYNRRNPERQAELDAVRARALRAAEFFGVTLPKPEQEWLAGQKDAGTDLLALRSRWVYPAPHTH